MAVFTTTFFSLALQCAPRGEIPRPAFPGADFASSDSKKISYARDQPSRVNDRPR